MSIRVHRNRDSTSPPHTHGDLASALPTIRPGFFNHQLYQPALHSVIFSSSVPTIFPDETSRQKTTSEAPRERPSRATTAAGATKAAAYCRAYPGSHDGRHCLPAPYHPPSGRARSIALKVCIRVPFGSQDHEHWAGQEGWSRGRKQGGR